MLYFLLTVNTDHVSVICTDPLFVLHTDHVSVIYTYPFLGLSVTHTDLSVVKNDPLTVIKMSLYLYLTITL